MTEVAPDPTHAASARGPGLAVQVPAAAPGGFRRAAARLLLLSFTALVGLDWWQPLAGTLPFIVACCMSVLAWPWAAVVLGRDRNEEAALASLGEGSRRRTLLLHLSLAALLGGFLFAKWLVLLQAGGRLEFVGPARSYSLAILIVVALGLFARSMRAARLFAQVTDHPARLMALSFGSAGLLGAALLSLPVSVENVSDISLIDNLFMAFSAVCVTGLAVNNIAETYSIFGQVVLCVLIQIGGLGIMVLSAAFAIMAGQRLRVKSSAVIAQMVDASSLANLRRTVLMILFYTLLLEGIGVAIFYSQFAAYPELAFREGSDRAGPGGHFWASLFHAVSAFCNAGFSNTYGGLVPFAHDNGILLTATALIILGGLGFPVLDELFRAGFTKLRRKRLPSFTLHTRIAVGMSAILLGLMTVAYLASEWGGSMSHLGPVDRLSAALFHSASARTAGFNVVDVAAMRPAMLVLTCAAMFVGACPGSTGGGIKTTTVAVLFSGMRAELKGQTPQLLNRTVPESVVRKAIGVAFLSLTIVVLAFTLLLLFEPHGPLDLGFEVMSAFTTTGLSTGVTPKLGVPGKLLIVLMMFIGRIGPLTLALAFSLAAKPSTIELPQERVMIG